jgi:hypothetical protein
MKFIDGKTYTFSQEQTLSFSFVNDSSNMVYYLYQFYRGFATLILFISFGNYCKNKYLEIFADRGETE